MFMSGIALAIKQYHSERLALIAGIIAFAVIGLVDHYPWTLIQTQTLWFGLLAIALSHHEQHPQN
jgi:uncharacterized membrane protein YccC